MFVELIETLRCPRSHDETPLIASAARTEARHIVDGVLGCPACGAEFRISGGVAHFDAPASATPNETVAPETALRLAAFLQLTDAGGFVLLCGRPAAQADAIQRLTETRLVLVNPPTNVPPDVAAAVLIVRDVLPIAAESARAAALDDTMGDALVASAVRATRSRGRLVASTSLALPAGVTEIARDARTWVAEKTEAPDAAPRLISLTRGTR